MGLSFFTCLSGFPCYSMLSNFMFSFPCCDVRYECRVKRCSVRLYYYLLCRRFTFYLCFLYLLTHTDVQHDFTVRWCWCHLTVTRRVTIVEQELPTLREHLRSLPDFCGVRVARSFVSCIVFVDRCLSFCPSSIYGFWLPLWYLKNLII